MVLHNHRTQELGPAAPMSSRIFESMPQSRTKVSAWKGIPKGADCYPYNGHHRCEVDDVAAILDLPGQNPLQVTFVALAGDANSIHCRHCSRLTCPPSFLFHTSLLGVHH